MYEKPKAYFDYLVEAFKTNPDRGKAIAAVVQFNITGPNGGSWALDLTQSPGVVTEGAHAAPKCTFTITDTDFLDVVNKVLNGQMAFMQGKLKVSGAGPDYMTVALKIGTLL